MRFTRKTFAILSAVVVVILGSLFHFVYEWSGKHDAVAWFASVDESVWEHLKLFFWPYTLMTIMVVLSPLASNNVWYSRAVGLVYGMCMIPVLFYSYTGGNAKKAILVIDIAIFVFAAICAEIVSYLYSATRGQREECAWGGVAIFVFLGTCFVMFSYMQ